VLRGSSVVGSALWWHGESRGREEREAKRQQPGAFKDQGQKRKEGSREGGNEGESLARHRWIGRMGSNTGRVVREERGFSHPKTSALRKTAALFPGSWMLSSTIRNPPRRWLTSRCSLAILAGRSTISIPKAAPSSKPRSLSSCSSSAEQQNGLVKIGAGAFYGDIHLGEYLSRMS
jgi:hypothetical protein